MNKVIENIFNKTLLSDLRFIHEENAIIAWSKRSRFKIIIPKKIDERIAYLSGAIIGDGNITITKRKVTKYPRLRLTIFNASKKYLSFLNKEFYCVFKINGKITKKKDKNCYVLTINQKLVVLYFLQIIKMHPGKKSNLEIPIAVRNRDLFRFFVAGLYDTDGFFSKTFGIMMNGSNYGFLRDVSALLEEYYNISSRKLFFGCLNTDKGPRFRSQAQIRTRDIQKFINTMPLKHNKYGPMV